MTVVGFLSEREIGDLSLSALSGSAGTFMHISLGTYDDEFEGQVDGPYASCALDRREVEELRAACDEWLGAPQ